MSCWRRIIQYILFSFVLILLFYRNNSEIQLDISGDAVIVEATKKMWKKLFGDRDMDIRRIMNLCQLVKHCHRVNILPTAVDGDSGKIVITMHMVHDIMSLLFRPLEQRLLEPNHKIVINEVTDEKVSSHDKICIGIPNRKDLFYFKRKQIPMTLPRMRPILFVLVLALMIHRIFHKVQKC